MSIGSEEELLGLRAAGRVVAKVLEAMKAAVREGITTAELDELGARVMAAHGARSAPKLSYAFPGATCISVNDEAVHGVPGARVLRRGDLVSLDVTVELDGFYADAAVTVGVPPVAEEAARLVACAEAAFWKGARAARHGRRLYDVGGAVEDEVARRGFEVVRDVCGHGVGRAIHEEPSVLNHRDGRVTGRVHAGLVLALEPIVSVSARRTRETGDGWTLASEDGSLTAHHEHTFVVTRGAPVILTVP
ncbi:MAG: type I methionyl aminopeptidase [Anaeromyxobacter sp.]